MKQPLRAWRPVLWNSAVRVDRSAPGAASGWSADLRGCPHLSLL